VTQAMVGNILSIRPGYVGGRADGRAGYYSPPERRGERVRESKRGTGLDALRACER
jgi:hypothetical protein